MKTSTMRTVQVKVPDIGDFASVAVIEVHVKVGDAVQAGQTLLTLESDKAAIEVPSDVAGVITQLKVQVGDVASEGSVIALVETAQSCASVAAPQAPPSSAAIEASLPERVGGADLECDVLVLGGGPGGYSAAFRAADLGMETILVEREAVLGGVCLNAGCIPSKALLHTAAVLQECKSLERHGIHFGAPTLDLDALRGYKDGVIMQLTDGLAGLAKSRKVQVVTGSGAFAGPNHLQVTHAGRTTVVGFKKAIIAVGSRPAQLPCMPVDERVVDSTGALELRQIPGRMLVIGGGIIGLEMATIYAALGSEIDIVETLAGLMAGADRDLVQVWEKHNAGRFSRRMLNTRAVQAIAREDGIHVSFEGEQAPAQGQRYDLVLVAVGRTPNGARICAEKAGVDVDQAGFLAVDGQMRTNVAHIFAIGDVVGQPMLAHKAVHEGHVAAEAAFGAPTRFDALQVPSVAYTNPEVAWAGRTEDECQALGIAYEKAVFPWAASGRAIANGRDEGFTKLLFDAKTQRVIGGAIVGTSAGDLIGEVCLAVEMGANATDIGRTIHPHPTLAESVGMAAEIFEGVCTDVPAQRRR